jgi:hypothetical protein
MLKHNRDDSFRSSNALLHGSRNGNAAAGSDDGTVQQYDCLMLLHYEQKSVTWFQVSNCRICFRSIQIVIFSRYWVNKILNIIPPPRDFGINAGNFVRISNPEFDILMSKLED